MPSTHQERRDFARRLAPLRFELVTLARRLTDRESDAEDVLQSAFAEAWRHYCDAADIENFRAWIARFIVNQSSNLRRRSQRPAEAHAPLTEDDGLGFVDPARELELELEYDALSGCFDRLMERIDARLAVALEILAPAEREALLLRSVLDFSCDEIATVQEAPRGTILARLHRARVKVRRALVEEPAMLGRSRG